MKVTICIPVFNCETWVATAIRSALEQTWPDKEIIVVDDGSTDRSAEICQSFGDRIRFVRQPNQGGNAARNRAAQMAMGEWIQFLDADDYLEPAKVYTQLAVMRSGDDVDVLYGPVVFETWNEDSKIDSAVQAISADSDLLALWLGWNMPQTGGCLWRTDSFRKLGGWNQSIKCNQEYELYFRALQRNLRFQFIGAPLAVYRIWSEQTVCRRDKPKLIEAKTELIHQFVAWLEEQNRMSPFYQQLAGQACFEMARTLASFDLDLAKQYYARRKIEKLIYPAGPAAPWKYRLLLESLGFVAAERIAKLARRP
jgi:Glycosyl transferase family 2